jgi:cytochrome d ubiquinol oxidase subunit II
MVSVLVSVAAGAVILFPSLALLFRLTLTGQLDRDAQAHRRVTRGQPDAKRPAWSARAAVASLVVAVALLTLADAGVAHAVGVVALGSTALFGYQAVGPDLLAAQPSRVHVEPPPRGPRW